MSLGTMFWIITAVLCGAFLFISWKVSGKAKSSFKEYAIGGKSFPWYLLFFTQFATIMGVGNFVGHAGKGYANGMPWMWFILGEQGSKIIFALAIAGFAGKFAYKTFPELIHDLISRDKVTRLLSGILASSIMIAWTGGQGKAFGAIFNVVTGANPIPIIILFSAVFILYTTLGGIHSVVWTDLFQGILVLIFGTIFYIVALGKINFSLAVLSERLAAIGKGEMMGFGLSDPLKVITMLVTGTVGIIVAQIYWQRCFSAKSARVAKTSLFWSGLISILMVMLTAVVGMIILTLNQSIKPDNAMPWFMMNAVPTFVAAMIFTLILAAGMSSADSNLNSASVLIVNDVILPFRPELKDDQLVNLAKIFTVIIGVVACAAAIIAPSIMDLFSRAYSMAGAGLVPLLVIGVAWKQRPGEAFAEGKRNSRITPWASRSGIVAGAVLSQIKALGPNRLLLALAVSAIVIVVVSLFTPPVKDEPAKVTA